MVDLSDLELQEERLMSHLEIKYRRVLSALVGFIRNTNEILERMNLDERSKRLLEQNKGLLTGVNQNGLDIQKILIALCRLEEEQAEELKKKGR